jgi:hypothetical protein
MMGNAWKRAGKSAFTVSRAAEGEPGTATMSVRFLVPAMHRASIAVGNRA